MHSRSGVVLTRWNSGTGQGERRGDRGGDAHQGRRLSPQGVHVGHVPASRQHLKGVRRRTYHSEGRRDGAHLERGTSHTFAAYVYM
jgi:hypothetical protein